MLHNNEALNLLKQLKRRFREEGLGTLRLEDSQLMTTVQRLAAESTNLYTKELAIQLLRWGLHPTDRKALFANVLQNHANTESNTGAGNLPRIFHGQDIRGRDVPDEETCEEKRKRALSVYRNN